MKAVVLSSGGLDSSVLMLMMQREGIEMRPLHVNYGQVSELQEWRACGQICAHLKIGPPERIDLRDLGRIPSGITNRQHPDQSVFFPARNLLLATVGAAFAYSEGIDTVAIGLISNAVFPDQTRTFVTAAESAISEAIGHHMSVFAPLIALDKRDIYKIAKAHGLPIERTYSCHGGGLTACGHCAACQERAGAEAALRDEEAREPPSDSIYLMRWDALGERDSNG